jgi:predicted DNA-binding mobile mystery protein A
MNTQKLQLQQISEKTNPSGSLNSLNMPPTGWIKAIRKALGMTMEQLGNKLSVTKQSVLDIERREKEGAITIKALKEVAKALDMQLVYGFVPNDGSIDALIEKRAKALAIKIVERTSNSMMLEDQQVSYERLTKAVEERTETIIKEMPKMLWD